jgi:hypothetical protein
MSYGIFCNDMSIAKIKIANLRCVRFVAVLPSYPRNRFAMRSGTCIEAVRVINTCSDSFFLPSRNEKAPCCMHALRTALITFLSRGFHSASIQRWANNHFADSGNDAGFCS